MPFVAWGKVLASHTCFIYRVNASGTPAPNPNSLMTTSHSLFMFGGVLAEGPH